MHNKKNQTLLKKDKGLTAPMAIVVFAAAAMMFLASLHLHEAALMDFPSNIAIQQQFNDIGNGISTELTAAIIMLPARGKIEFDEQLPHKIGGYGFELNVSKDRIHIKSHKGFYIDYTLSGMDKELNVTGRLSEPYGGRAKSVRFDLHRWQ